MHVSFDRAKSALADENDVDITFHLREKPRFAAQTGTWAGDGEATAQMSARAENLFGGAERIEGVLEAGTRTRNAWEVKLQSPIAANPNMLGEVSVFGMARDYKFFASHELLQRGAHAKLKVSPPICPFPSLFDGNVSPRCSYRGILTFRHSRAGEFTTSLYQLY